MGACGTPLLRVGSLFARALAAGLLFTLFQPVSLAKKKNKRAERLQSLESVYVDGTGFAADYIRRNLRDQRGRSCAGQATKVGLWATNRRGG